MCNEYNKNWMVKFPIWALNFYFNSSIDKEKASEIIFSDIFLSIFRKKLNTCSQMFAVSHKEMSVACGRGHDTVLCVKHHDGSTCSNP